MFEKITIVKYGSGVMAKETSQGVCPQQKLIDRHGRILTRQNTPILIVSSGAVAFGASKVGIIPNKNNVVLTSALASLGNPDLHSAWQRALGKDINLMLALLTHRDLKEGNTSHLEQIIRMIYGPNSPFRGMILVNDNDFVSDEELKLLRGGVFGDNDEITMNLALLFQSIFKKVKVVFNTSVDGVMAGGALIPQINARQLTDEYIKSIVGAKTSLGTGGMSRKLKIARQMVADSNGSIKVTILNGKKPAQLAKYFYGESIGTKIII